MGFTLHYRLAPQPLPKINTYLNFDPGTKNFAFCVVQGDVVVACGMLKNAIQKITNKNNKEFRWEIKRLLSVYDPDIVTSERFMIRGFLSYLVELVNQMIGSIDTLCDDQGRQHHQITAAQWKTAIKKHVNMKALYKEAYKLGKVPPHIVDCLCTICYIKNGKKYTRFDGDWLRGCLPDLQQKMVN